MGMGDGRDFRKHAGRLQRGKCFFHYSTPSNEPGPPRRAVVSFRKTSSKQRNVMRSFGGSVSNAPRELPTWNLDERSVKCSAMLTAALHSTTGPWMLKMDTLSCCFRMFSHAF